MRKDRDKTNIYKYLIHRRLDPDSLNPDSYVVAHPTLNLFNNYETNRVEFADIGEFVASIINKYVELKSSSAENAALQVDEYFVIDNFCDYVQNADISIYKQMIDNVLLETDKALYSTVQKYFVYTYTSKTPCMIYSYDTINMPIPNYSENHTLPVTLQEAEEFFSIPVELRTDDNKFFRKYDSTIFKHLIFDSFDSMFKYAIMHMVEHNIIFKKCENCGKYFCPSSRSDEKYCNNVFKNGKTCRQLGYEIKISNDELLKTYRSAYKTANGWKNRNKNNVKDVDALFDNWHKSAKEKLRQAQNGDISIDDYKQWFKNNNFRNYAKRGVSNGE